MTPEKQHSINRAISSLKQQLHDVRQKSLAANRKNDYKTVAALTEKARGLNRKILELQGLWGFS